MATIAQLTNCAVDHLSDFVDPIGPWKSPNRSGPRSFHTYDRQGDASKFDSLDALAPSLLDAGLRPMEINQMFSGNDTDNPFNNLRMTIEKCLKELAGIKDHRREVLDFSEADLLSGERPWSLVHACYIASEDTKQIGYSKVSKMLHRKIPTYIPIIDSKLLGFYGLRSQHLYGRVKLKRDVLEKYLCLLQADFRKNRNFLNDISDGVLTSEGNPVSSLRVADIVIWEHIMTKCSRAVVAR